MFNFARFMMPVLLVMVSVSAVSRSASAYKRRPADPLGMSVWRDEAFRTGVRELPDGRIPFPLAGRFEVARLDRLLALG